jgi:hypothetical protein
VSWLTLTLMLASAPDMRIETQLDFEVDETLQRDGGVQYFYGFATPAQARAPAEGSALAKLRELDDHARPNEALYVMMNRIVYTVERDVSFFTEARARDVTYINDLAPEARVTLNERGMFHAAMVPANNFTIEWQEPVPAKSPMFNFIPAGARPASLVVQRNFNFARIMGFKTAERSVTWTAHVPLGQGRTRVFVCMLSVMHNIPPPFMGGQQRVYREAVDNTAMLISRLREYDGP